MLWHETSEAYKKWYKERQIHIFDTLFLEGYEVEIEMNRPALWLRFHDKKPLKRADEICIEWNKENSAPT